VPGTTTEPLRQRVGLAERRKAIFLSALVFITQNRLIDELERALTWN